MAVMVHRRGQEDRHRAVGLVEAHDAIVGNVGPDEIFARGEIGGTLGPATPRIELVEMDVAMREPFESLVENLKAGREHRRFFPLTAAGRRLGATFSCPAPRRKPSGPPFSVRKRS